MNEIPRRHTIDFAANSAVRYASSDCIDQELHILDINRSFVLSQQSVGAFGEQSKEKYQLRFAANSVEGTEP